MIANDVVLKVGLRLFLYDYKFNMSQQYDVVAKNKHQNCRHDRNVIRIKESHGYTAPRRLALSEGPISVLSECLIDGMGPKETGEFSSSVVI